MDSPPRHASTDPHHPPLSVHRWPHRQEHHLMTYADLARLTELALMLSTDGSAEVTE